jgi:uncharacterized membrane protein YphA (DoxX/SURF4 family)
MKSIFQKLTSLLIAMVWLVNGLFCKILNLVPRHQQIVGRILGGNHAFLFTKIIGVAEIIMTIWIITGIKSRFCTILQIIIVLTMNSIELVLVPDLLLFGRWNMLVAICFAILLFVNEYLFKSQPSN